MIFGVEVSDQTTVLSIAGAVFSGLVGLLVYTFKVVIPKMLERSDQRFDMMLGKVLDQVETGWTFLRDELAKQDSVLTMAMEKFGTRVDTLTERISECPNRNHGIPLATSLKVAH